MKRLLWSGALVLAAPPLSRAVDVSGEYENTGAAVSAAPAAAVPLRGLVGLEFDPALARRLFSGTESVVLIQQESSFNIQCRAADGSETWSGSWTRETGYAVEKDRVTLVLRAGKRYGDQSFLFTLSGVGDQKLLLVDVQRITPTLLGPELKPWGQFVFARVAGK